MGRKGGYTCAYEDYNSVIKQKCQGYNTVMYSARWWWCWRWAAALAAHIDQRQLRQSNTRHLVRSVSVQFSRAPSLPALLSSPPQAKSQIKYSHPWIRKKVIIAAHLSRQHHGVSIYTALIHNPCPEGRKFSQVNHFCLTRVRIGQGDWWEMQGAGQGLGGAG